MRDAAYGSSEYRVEVSGWGLDDTFFAEKTDLLWTDKGEKKLLLRRCLPEGAIIFIRLIGNDTALGSVPVAYQVENVQPMNRLGLCEMRLHELHPRSKPATSCLPVSDARKNQAGHTKTKHEPELTDTEEIVHEA
jgi:hypothetical protein